MYWRRNARTGVLVSKEMTQVSPPRLLLLVDSFVAGDQLKELAEIEQTIAMAASLGGGTALEAGLSVGLRVWDGLDLSSAQSRQAATARSAEHSGAAAAQYFRRHRPAHGIDP